MKKVLLVFLVSIAVAALVCPVVAQTGAGKGQKKGPPVYNPETVTTIKGTVLAVGAAPGKVGRTGLGMQDMLIKTDQGNVRVLLAPKPYLDQQQFSLKPGDMVEVTGSQFTRRGQQMMMAREVKAGDKTFMLRTEQGALLWKAPGAGGGPPGAPAPPEHPK